MKDELSNDFPIDWEEDQYVSRREFVRFLSLASGGLAVGSLAMAGWNAAQRERREFEPKLLAMVGDLKPGDSREFRFPRSTDLCLLICRPDGSLGAFSVRCTHLSCPVEFEPQRDRFYCPCHNGAFSLEDGRVLQGPPPHPLPQIEIEVRDGAVYAVGVMRGEHA